VSRVDQTSLNRLTYDRISRAYLQRQLKYAEDGDDLFVDLERRWRLSLPVVGLVADVGSARLWTVCASPELGIG